MKLFAISIGVLILLVSCGNKNNMPAGSGLIESTEVSFTPQTSGQLIAIYFDEGQQVNSGDTLALIDTSTVILKFRQAKAAGDAAASRLNLSGISIKQTNNNLDLAQKEYSRIEQLIKSGSANQQQFDQAENSLRQAQLAKEQAQMTQRTAQSDLDNAGAQIALLNKQVNDCFPISPANGTVVNKYFEVGEFVATGRPLVKIAKLDTVWVKIYLPPADLTKIKLGEHALVDPEDAHNKPLDGAITWISSEAEFTPKNVQTKEARAGLLYAVKVSIPNPNQILKIGMPVMVTVQ